MASYDAYDKNKNNFTGYELEKGEYQLKLAYLHLIEKVDIASLFFQMQLN